MPSSVFRSYQHGHHLVLPLVPSLASVSFLHSSSEQDTKKANSEQFDDFVVTHIQQTLTIHYTGNFMPWHRWFVYSYETALRDECNYTGYQPVSI